MVLYVKQHETLPSLTATFYYNLWNEAYGLYIVLSTGKGHSHITSLPRESPACILGSLYIPALLKELCKINSHMKDKKWTVVISQLINHGWYFSWKSLNVTEGYP